LTNVSTRAVRCRYLRRDGNQCPNEIAAQGDEEVLLCFKASAAGAQQVP
jgi:hypothetical protein